VYGLVDSENLVQHVRGRRQSTNGGPTSSSVRGGLTVSVVTDIKLRAQPSLAGCQSSPIVAVESALRLFAVHIGITVCQRLLLTASINQSDTPQGVLTA
jgi:hypothetical protein